jgi:hypothetical protein
VAGKLGRGVSFDGVNDVVSANDNPSILNLRTVYTVSAWIYPTVIKARPDNIIVCRGAWNYALELDTNGHVSVWTNNSAHFSANTPLAVNQWYHIVWTHNYGSDKIYVQGIQDGTGGIGNPVDNPASVMRIGGYSQWAVNFTGPIDDVRIFNYALTASKVAQMYNSTKTGIWAMSK